ncbi:MAG: PIN domain-containing protein [Anaerolineae bacterium]|nr:PIN domain-containing protein [Anaerolineae bacterium]NUQ04703.1 PIN domain-containing protein [Anaerolineae bacterium]
MGSGWTRSARNRLLTVPARDITVSSIVRAGSLCGAARSQTPELTRQKQGLFLQPFAALPFDDAAASHYAVLRAALESRGTPIVPLDMQIAAIALANSLILVTHNTQEFSRIAGLRTEDW